MKLLKNLRKAKNIDIKDLSKATGLSVDYLEKVDDMTFGMLPLDNAIKIAKVLDITLEILEDYEEI